MTSQLPSGSPSSDPGDEQMERKIHYVEDEVEKEDVLDNPNPDLDGYGESGIVRETSERMASRIARRYLGF